MTRNIIYALNSEEGFIVNFVNEFKYCQEDKLYPLLNYVASKLLKEVTVKYPNKSYLLNSNYKSISKRGLLNMSLSNLTDLETVNFVNSCNLKNILFDIESNWVNKLTFGGFKWAILNRLTNLLKTNFHNLSKEETVLKMKALIYLTLLYKTDDTAN